MESTAPGHSITSHAKTSLVYRNPWVYELLMILLYGPHYAHRYQALSALIPENSTVTDVCCGPAVLYHRYLKQKQVRYTGVDVNEAFIKHLVQKCGQGIVMDVQGDLPIPPAETVLMQASLYHFLPDGVDAMMDKLLGAATRQVIIAEPVKNLSDGKIPLLSSLARRSADPGTGHQSRRFNEASLDQAMLRFRSRFKVETQLVANGREKVFIISL